MESIKLRPRTQCLSILTEENFRSCRRVYNHDRYVSELDLIDVSPLLCPLAILFSCIDSNLSNVANEGYTGRTFQSWYTCLCSYIFIGDDVGNG